MGSGIISLHERVARVEERVANIERMQFIILSAVVGQALLQLWLR